MCVDFVFITNTHTRIETKRKDGTISVEHFQYMRSFLLSGIFPRASIWFLATFRFMFVLAFGWYMYLDTTARDSVHLPPPDRFKSILRLPLNWVAIIVLSYLILHLIAAVRSKSIVMELFDKPPTPILFLVMWNLFSLLMPTLMFIAITYPRLKPNFQSENQFALSTLSWMLVVFECIFGAQHMTHHVLVTPVLGMLIFLLYTFVAQLQYSIQMHDSIDWVTEPGLTLSLAATLIQRQFMLAAISGLIFIARTQCMGVKLFKTEPVEGSTSRRGRMFDMSVLIPNHSRYRPSKIAT